MLNDPYFKNSFGNNLPVSENTQNMTQIVYLLQLISVFTGGLFLLVPLFINYIYRKNTRDTWLDCHFRWQIQTFWFSILFYSAGMFFLLIPFIGWLISMPFFTIASVIILIRTVKGWIKFTKQLPPSTII